MLILNRTLLIKYVNDLSVKKCKKNYEKWLDNTHVEILPISYSDAQRCSIYTLQKLMIDIIFSQEDRLA